MLNLNERLSDLGQSGYCAHLAMDSVVHHEIETIYTVHHMLYTKQYTQIL